MTAESNKRTVWQKAKAPLLILVLALAARLAYACGTGKLQAPMRLDEPEYTNLAKSLLAGRGYALERGPTAFRPPVFPLFIASVFAVGGPHAANVRLVQLIISAGTCVLIYYLARACRLAPPAPMFAAAICVVHPLHWILALMLFPETLYLAALSTILLICVSTAPRLRGASRGHWASAAAIGALVGATALLRSEAVLYFGLLALWTLSWRIPVRRRIITIAAMLAAGVLVMSPWWVRNYVVFDRFIPLSTNGGVVLWNGNNPLARGGTVDALPENWRGESPPPDLFYHGWSTLGELESSERFRGEALRWIRENPGRFLLLLPLKALRMLRVDARGNFRPPGLHWAWNIPYGIFLAIAVWGTILIRRRRGPLYLPCVPLIATSIACLIAIGSTRYGAPISISAAVLAAPALVEMWRKSSERLTKSVAEGSSGHGGRE